MKMHQWSARLLALIGLLVVGVVPAWAADCGDTAGPGGTNVPCSCGDTVVTSTVLNGTDPVLSTGPADVCPADGLYIGASGITLSLGGKTIRGSGSGTGLSLGGFDDVTIKRGFVDAFDVGVSVSFGHGNVVSNVTASNVAVGFDLFGASGDAASGVPGNQLSANVVAAGSVNGIVLDASHENIVEKSKITGASLEGIVLYDSSRNVVRNNQVSGSGAGVVLCQGDENTFNANRALVNGVGLWLVGACGPATGNVISLNITDGNGADGMLIETDGNRLIGNRGKGNSDDGLDITGTGNDVDYNVFDQNGDWGICVDPGNVDTGGNRATRNVNGQISFTGACTH